MALWSRSGADQSGSWKAMGEEKYNGIPLLRRNSQSQLGFRFSVAKSKTFPFSFVSDWNWWWSWADRWVPVWWGPSQAACLQAGFCQAKRSCGEKGTEATYQRTRRERRRQLNPEDGSAYSIAAPRKSTSLHLSLSTELQSLFPTSFLKVMSIGFINRVGGLESRDREEEEEDGMLFFSFLLLYGDINLGERGTLELFVLCFF